MSSSASPPTDRSRQISTSTANGRSVEDLRAITRWIRDELDPLIAREGSTVMTPDTVLALNQVFNDLLQYPIDLETCQQSRIHKAIQLIASKGTRWPSKLIELCDGIIECWHQELGPLHLIGTPLYGPGGRLNGICRPNNLNLKRLIDRWCKNKPALRLLSHQHGHLRCQPGDWWIAPQFAFRSGMIDEKTINGGITFDEKGAYAILMTGRDELEGTNLESLTYRTRHDDRGRYICTKADPRRQPVRILRSHKLASLLSPKVGVRYDGLYKVTGWVISTIDGVVTYDIRLTRLEGQASIQKTCRHPNSEEVDDYMEYKRIQALERTKVLEGQLAKMDANLLRHAVSLVLHHKPSDSLQPQLLGASSRYTKSMIFNEAPTASDSLLPDPAALRTQKSILNRQLTVRKRQGPSTMPLRDSITQGLLQPSLREGRDDTHQVQRSATTARLHRRTETGSLTGKSSFDGANESMSRSGTLLWGREEGVRGKGGVLAYTRVRHERPGSDASYFSRSSSTSAISEEMDTYEVGEDVDIGPFRPFNHVDGGHIPFHAVSNVECTTEGSTARFCRSAAEVSGTWRRNIIPIRRASY